MIYPSFDYDMLFRSSSKTRTALLNFIVLACASEERFSRGFLKVAIDAVVFSSVCFSCVHFKTFALCLYISSERWFVCICTVSFYFLSLWMSVLVC